MRRWARRMKRRIRVLVAILQDRQTPWYVRLLAGVVVAYAASPIDLIPDFIPVLGYLDDLILIPLGVWLVFAVTPQAVRVRAARRVVSGQAGGVSCAAPRFPETPSDRVIN